MKKQKRGIVRLALKTMTIALVLSLHSPAFLSAFDEDNVYAGYYMWQLINEAREHPADFIQKKEYGIVLDDARRALKENAWILEKGLPPLAWNKKLAVSSSSHTDDMILKKYYAYNSQDTENTSFEQRIEAIGYSAKSTGESLGLLAFNVYLEPLDAVEKLFENMLKDELNPDLVSRRNNIFSTDHTEVGIGFTSAVFEFENAPPFNAYVVTADFAAPVEPRYFMMGLLYNDESSSFNELCDEEDAFSGWNLQQPAGAVCSRRKSLEGTSYKVAETFFGYYQVEIPSSGGALCILVSEGRYVCLSQKSCMNVFSTNVDFGTADD